MEPTEEPNQFYTGMVADLYRPLRSVAPDPAPYGRFIARSGEPALELGCGEGDPLLDLLEQGLQVEGVDASADMLNRCRAAAAERGLEAVLHHQPMEALDVGRTFRSIFLAGPTFNLLSDDVTAAKALTRIRAHLTPDGAALVPLFIPSPLPAEARGRARERAAEDGAVIRVTAIDESRDESERTQRTTLRYERIADGDHTAVERPLVLHWHTQEGFRRLAADAGLSTRAVLAADGTPAAAAAAEFTFWLRPTLTP